MKICDKVTIYTMKTNPEFEVNINGHTKSVSFKSKRTKDEAWKIAVDTALEGKKKVMKK